MTNEKTSNKSYEVLRIVALAVRVLVMILYCFCCLSWEWNGKLYSCWRMLCSSSMSAWITTQTKEPAVLKQHSETLAFQNNCRFLLFKSGKLGRKVSLVSGYYLKLGLLRKGNCFNLEYLVSSLHASKVLVQDFLGWITRSFCRT